MMTHLTDRVLDAIDSELKYQHAQSLDPSRPDMIPVLSPGEIIAAMEHCLLAAHTAWYAGAAPHREAAEHIRKVTALGVRFLSENTAPMRTDYTPKS